MDGATLLRALEAVLFASAEPVAVERLAAVFEPDGVGADQLRGALESLRDGLATRGIELQEVAGGVQLRTRAEFARWVARLEVPKPFRFTRPALETLAVIAYRQPITRAELEDVRGVDCAGVVKTLLEKGLLRIVGKKDVPGRPLLYATARKFLETFGLSSLGALPTLRDLEELAQGRGEPVSLEREADEVETTGRDGN